jgi:uncharacterized membrane protein YfcA
VSIAAALVIGFAAGMVAGLLGVGGGILFVPALSLALGLGQVDAEATSLLAIVPVSLVGAYRQNGYGNVRIKDAIVIGLLSAAGVFLGVAVANAIPERVLQLLFAALTLFVASQVFRRGLRQRRERLAEEAKAV